MHIVNMQLPVTANCCSAPCQHEGSALHAWAPASVADATCTLAKSSGRLCAVIDCLAFSCLRSAFALNIRHGLYLSKGARYTSSNDKQDQVAHILTRIFLVSSLFALGSQQSQHRPNRKQARARCM